MAGGRRPATTPRAPRSLPATKTHWGRTVDKLDGKDIAYLVSKNSYKDFEIRAEFWVDEEANSGIFLRCDQSDKIDSKICYEVNVFDKRPDPSYGTGAIVDVAKVDPMPRAA